MATTGLSRPVVAAEKSSGDVARSPRDRSPATAALEEDMARYGYVSSPLRTQQRLASLGSTKDLPDPPKAAQQDGETQQKAPSVRWGTNTAISSFPFEAKPGTVGPLPTTEAFKANGRASETSPAPPVVQRRANGSGTATPPNRRSVQFARGPASTNGAGMEEDAAPSPLHKTTTWETDHDGHTIPSSKDRERQASFFGKLKALASPAGSSSFHTRGPSTSTQGYATPNMALSPQSERSEPTYPIEPSEAAEADVEESEQDEVNDLRPKKRRKSRRPNFSGSSAAADGTESAPTTPKQNRFQSFLRDHPIPGSSARPATSRRNTLSDDITDTSRTRHGGGVSEDEGRDRIRGAWRRGIEGARGLSYSARRHAASDNTGNADENAATNSRPGALRRFTGIGGLDTSTGSPFRSMREGQGGGRQASSSAQKWRQIKTGIKLLGQRKRDEKTRVDHQKSAQLMAELLAGAPAALVFASMYQRDEHGHRKVPVLLEQLKIKIPHSETRTDKAGDRHLVFQVDLEYGNGPARMQWTIRRALADFVQLHWKYKTQSAADKFRIKHGELKGRSKMPKFPKSAFPYGRGARGLFDKLEDEEEDDGQPGQVDGTMTPAPNTPGPTVMSPMAEVPETPVAGPAAPPGLRPGAGMRKHTRKTSFFAPPRRSSTGELILGDPDRYGKRQMELYTERQRRKLETYLQQMIRWLIFRADSTRLCKFLEISALAIRLSAEGGWQGKQGLLTIASRQHRELRRKGVMMAMGGSSFRERHKPRWFLVRHSYIVCVDGPESLIPYDVFLVDSDFRTEKRPKGFINSLAEQGVAEKSEGQGKTAGELAKAAVDTTTSGKNHLIRLYNSERKLKLFARNERQYLQFQESLNTMMMNTIWSKKQRFGSFAPVRNDVWARWLVDGRDHMWQVSRAIDNAKDFIYIHDWWLSPELYMRRPAAISQKWRLDRLLQRKAQEGVKIFVIVYRNIESAIPIDSEYTKWSLLDLHENICVQRSPNQFRQNQFFWAHHEKLVVVDNMMAFVGGVDLCFGRWDDPCHSLTDDKSTGFELNYPPNQPRDSDHCQVWPGKDYSNPRVQDFYALDRPYEEMYDRTKVPRMPWHDIAMQMVGQPARDVGRHFVQRWNYILRSRVPSRPTPVLLPPPEYDHAELERLGMTGTCQVQILRSCSPWSIGTPNKIEHSIMNAYCHLIRTSKHFVYIENQFYISSCTVEGTPIQNEIGDALVERAIQAHERGESWQACLVIPLMPGFQNSVDSQDGTSVRLIMQCQYRSICRGDTSIFGRLRAKGIEPEDYIRFYSLRQWGKIGPRKCLTTEQLYIHAKCMVVDDRHVIIGSANINERSMLGSRDSEVAAVVTDTKVLPSFMAGKPFEVGEFPHTLRKRLMREHLGIDVDAIYRREQQHREREAQDAEMERIYRDNLDTVRKEAEDYFATPPQTPPPLTLSERNLMAHADFSQEDERGRGRVFNESVTGNGWSGKTQTAKDSSEATSSTEKPEVFDPEKLKSETKKERERDMDVEGYGFDNMHALVEQGDIGLTDSFVDAHGHEVLLRKDAPDARRIKEVEKQQASRPSESQERKAELPARPPWPVERLETHALGLMPRSQLPELPALDDTDIGGPPLTRGLSQSSSAKIINPIIQGIRRPEVHEDCMTDPCALGFYHDIWNQVAENNTKLYRQVFRCMPDSEVLDWKQYEKFNDYNERFMQSQGLGSSKPVPAKEAPDKSGPPGSGGTEVGSVVTEKLSGGRARSKSVISNALGKLRPGSKASEDTHTEDMHEKENAVPGSPGSAASSDPTAVPSPESQPLDEKDATKQADEKDLEAKLSKEGNASFERKRTIHYSDNVNQAPETTATQTNPSPGLQHSSSQKRRRRATTKSSVRPAVEEVMSKDEAEDLLKLVQGTLVSWPYDWLEKEEKGGNWLYSIDQLAPLEIYD